MFIMFILWIKIRLSVFDIFLYNMIQYLHTAQEFNMSNWKQVQAVSDIMRIMSCFKLRHKDTKLCINFSTNVEGNKRL